MAPLGFYPCRIKYFRALSWGQSGIPMAGGSMDKGSCATICSGEDFKSSKCPSGLEGDFITTKISDPVSEAIWEARIWGYHLCVRFIFQGSVIRLLLLDF